VKLVSWLVVTKKKENIQRSVGLLWMPSQRKIKTNSLEYCDHGELIDQGKADCVLTETQGVKLARTAANSRKISGVNMMLAGTKHNNNAGWTMRGDPGSGGHYGWPRGIGDGSRGCGWWASLAARGWARRDRE
jgi:hypothetical protein